MKCFLHIGTEKTGTTFLQDWLYDNKKELSKNGVYLSEKLGVTNNRLVPAYFQNDLDDWATRNGIASVEDKKKYFAGFLEDLAAEIKTAKATHHSFVITSEHLHSRVRRVEEIQLLHAFLTSVFDDVEVICYFRDQFDVAVSLYSTALKRNSATDVDSFVEQAKPENYYYNYLAVADNWSQVFGKLNCNFRIYDRQRFIDNDIRKDFLSAIFGDIDLASFNMERDFSNESLFLLQSAAYKVVNAKIPYWKSDESALSPENSIAKHKIDNIDSLKIGKIVSTKGEAIRDRFREINRQFFSTYFDSLTEFPVSGAKSSNHITLDEAFKAVEDAVEFGLDANAIVMNALSDQEIDLIRDVALRIHNKKPLSINDALALMKVALKCRPNGPLIKSKVEQWSSIISSHN